MNRCRMRPSRAWLVLSNASFCTGRQTITTRQHIRNRCSEASPMDKWNWKEALPRIFADFVIVHLSMIGALAVSVVYRTAYGTGASAQMLVAGFAHYYTAFFWVLSPIFPLVFLLNGFYT